MVFESSGIDDQFYESSRQVHYQVNFVQLRYWCMGLLSLWNIKVSVIQWVVYISKYLGPCTFIRIILKSAIQVF